MVTAGLQPQAARFSCLMQSFDEEGKASRFDQARDMSRPSVEEAALAALFSSQASSALVTGASSDSAGVQGVSGESASVDNFHCRQAAAPAHESSATSSKALSRLLGCSPCRDDGAHCSKFAAAQSERSATFSDKLPMADEDVAPANIPVTLMPRHRSPVCSRWGGVERRSQKPLRPSLVKMVPILRSLKERDCLGPIGPCSGGQVAMSQASRTTPAGSTSPSSRGGLAVGANGRAPEDASIFKDSPASAAIPVRKSAVVPQVVAFRDRIAAGLGTSAAAAAETTLMSRATSEQLTARREAASPPSTSLPMKRNIGMPVTVLNPAVDTAASSAAVATTAREPSTEPPACTKQMKCHSRLSVPSPTGLTRLRSPKRPHLDFEAIEGEAPVLVL
eukprot:TRINITY_DN68262_c0_g1_i1.p1 TRINITY_DN68262_c0_g1~~TRINITY_DN68262_c0_g1_i1.p1  ORF type:complete len:400 (-),score=55.18 TRINITY_DN68262_c0_g1_i1:38-1213(-)